ncbi:MAG: hypothetical protein JWN72_2656 [Thermoleophilia bacterium]|nr:hypothetical protein [Thermoleophilia bacterium]
MGIQAIDAAMRVGAGAATATASHAGAALGPGWHELLATTRLGKGRMFQDVLDAQLRFKAVGEGAFQTRRIEPDSPAAERAMQLPAVRQAILGIVETIDAAQGFKQLDGITFSSDMAGYVANRAVQSMHGEASLSGFREAVGRSYAHVEGTGAVRAGNWIHFGPEKSLPLRTFTQDPGAVTPQLTEQLSRSIKTMLHEIAHIVTPRRADEGDLKWLSEGIAETWSRWPGNVEAASARMGVPSVPNFHKVLDAENEKYPDQVKTLRALLQLAGVDTANPASIAVFEKLVQKVGVSKVPLRLARRIEELHPGVTRDEVTKLIATLSTDTRDANPQPVLDLAQRLGVQLQLP